jgi:hypothetical protein
MCRLSAVIPRRIISPASSCTLVTLFSSFYSLYFATGYPGRSFLVAALFAVHPMNVETVEWVAERKSVLSTLFLFLAMAAYGAYVQTKYLLHYLLVCFFFAMGLMCKPMIITPPCLLVLLDCGLFKASLCRITAPPGASYCPPSENQCLGKSPYFSGRCQRGHNGPQPASRRRGRPH